MASFDEKTLQREVRGKVISVVPQGAMNSLNPTRKIRHMVIDVLREHYPEMSPREAVERGRERLEFLGLPPRVLDVYPHQLSGGMKQRVVTVISTLLNPKVLIVDEPTSALDVTSQKIVIKLLLDLLRKKIIQSIVFITHELPLLRHVADRIVIMYVGKIVELGTMQEIIFDPDTVHPGFDRLHAHPRAGDERPQGDRNPRAPARHEDAARRVPFSGALPAAVWPLRRGASPGQCRREGSAVLAAAERAGVGAGRRFGEVILETKGLTRVFGSGSHRLVAVDHVDFQIRSGEIVALIGESGSGKTTMGRMLLGLLAPTEGQVLFRGKGPRRVPQAPRDARVLAVGAGGLSRSLCLFQQLLQSEPHLDERL